MSLKEIRASRDEFRTIIEGWWIANPDKTINDLASEIGLEILTLRRFFFTDNEMTQRSLTKIYNYINAQQKLLGEK